MSGIMTNTAPYNKCDIIGTMEEQAIKHMGDERWGVFKQEVTVPDESAENIKRQKDMRGFVSAMEEEFGIELTKKIFSGVCHGLKPADLPWARENFLLYNDIDEFCSAMINENAEIFKKAYETGEWVHGQEIDKDVYEFLIQFPELLYGKRQGNSIVATAIPYNTKAYLNEKDPVKKRYHTCHCHFARDTILMDGGAVSKTLCYCSLGHTRVFWESVLNTPLEGEVIESVLGGGMMCKFRIDLPDEIMEKYVKER